jgi:hypothetical protein
MSFDRAADFYKGACHILRTGEATPGECAIIYACLAQVEATVALAGGIERAFPAAFPGAEIRDAEEWLDHESRVLIEGIHARVHPHDSS